MKRFRATCGPRRRRALFGAIFGVTMVLSLVLQRHKEQAVQARAKVLLPTTTTASFQDSLQGLATGERDGNDHDDSPEESVVAPSSLSDGASFATTAALMDQINHHRNRDLVETQQVQYLLGFSTGHAGSTTAHEFLADEFKGPSSSCGGWKTVKARFEAVLDEEKTRPFAQNVSSCDFVQQSVLPFLMKQRGSNHHHLWMDLGHYHNRHDILECLATLLQSQLAFVRIRRDRYQTARSFAKGNPSPCRDTIKPHKRLAVSYCPHSGERGGGPVALPVSDALWNQFTRFQKFLWLVDDMEYRWYQLLQTLASSSGDGTTNGVTWMHEVTWSTGDEFQAGLHQLLDELQCTTNKNGTTGTNNYNATAQKEQPLRNTKRHTNHYAGWLNCTQQIYDDLDYRRQMNFTAEQTWALFEQFPRQLLSHECAEDSSAQLPQTVLRLAAQLGVATNLRHWGFVRKEDAPVKQSL